MTNKQFELFIDESGRPRIGANLVDPYILSGGSIYAPNKVDVKNYADQIKFKFWGTTDVVFHSREISLDIEEFSIFQGKPDLKKEFLQDLMNLLRSSPLVVSSCIIDKAEAKKKAWIQTHKLVKETADVIFKNFIIQVYTSSATRGKIIIESSGEKDPIYLSRFNHFLANGISDIGISGEEVRGLVTSLSFVTKRNHDIETQLIDLLSYGAKCKFFTEKRSAVYAKGTYEDNIMRIFESKLFKLNAGTGKKKKSVLKKVDPFSVLPK